jgi:hypothetical protein
MFAPCLVSSKLAASRFFCSFFLPFNAEKKFQNKHKQSKQKNLADFLSITRVQKTFPHAHHPAVREFQIFTSTLFLSLLSRFFLGKTGRTIIPSSLLRHRSAVEYTNQGKIRNHRYVRR